MNIFNNLFGNRPDYRMPEIPGTKVEAPKQEEPKGPAYQVGLTPDGRVSLRIGEDYYGSTLTMNNEGVDALIRILQAAKPASVSGDEVDEVEDQAEQGEE